MKFFIPAAKDEQQASEVYEGTRRFCEEQTGWRTTPRRIYALRYHHNGEQYLAQVGDFDYTEGPVICIFETGQAFLVCTPDRAVIRGEPILVGFEEVSYVEDFEP